MTPLSVKEIAVCTTPELCTNVNVTLLPGRDFVLQCTNEDFIKCFGSATVHFTPESFEAVNWERIYIDAPILKEMYHATKDQVLCCVN